MEEPAAATACPNCGAANPRNAALCTRCSFALHAPPPLPPSAGDEALSALIPYKNSSALIAYYLGLFSVIPIAGFFLAVAAVILGVKGLRYARERPEARGKTHALVGILVGGFVGLIHGALTAVFLVAAASRRP